MSRGSELTVFAPDLFAARFVGPQDMDPALARALSLAVVEALALVPPEQRLFELFGYEVGVAGPPVATVGAALDGVAERPGRTCFRADPVHLRADPGRMFLFSARHLDLTDSEADALLEHLNATLEGIELERGRDPTRWYAHLPTPAVAAPPPASLDGAVLTSAGDDDARELRRWMNEIQMVLHEAPANAARERRGTPAVNSVWFWGAGAMPATTDRLPAAVQAEDFLARALARHHGVDEAELDPGRPPAGSVLVVAGAPTGAAPAAAAPRPVDWTGILSALRRGRLARVVILTDSHRFSISPAAAWRWWRPTRPRAHWVRLRQAVLDAAAA